MNSQNIKLETFTDKRSKQDMLVEDFFKHIHSTMENYFDEILALTISSNLEDLEKIGFNRQHNSNELLVTKKLQSAIEKFDKIDEEAISKINGILADMTHKKTELMQELTQQPLLCFKK
jgi:hypothetical protein